MAQFLSDEWLEEVEKIRSELGESAIPEGLADLQMNIVVTGGPEGDKNFHFAGGMNFQKGHLDNAPTTIFVPYEVARQMFVDGDMQAAMQAFMQGQVRIEGDMSRIMAMQGNLSMTSGQEDLQAKIKQITD